MAHLMVRAPRITLKTLSDLLIIRIPFYYTLKTVFLLYIALPQTRGSSYIYVNHLQPFFHSHETQIDAALASFKARIYTFIQERLRALWEQAAASVGQQQQANFNPVGGATNTGAQPSLSDPASGPAQLVSSLWRSYGPSIIASGTALLRQSSAASANNSQPALTTPPPSYIRSDTTQSVLERRRQLEAELAALGTNDAPVPMPMASPALNPSRGSSSSDLHLRERTNSGRFEEIEVPSDVEGYDVGDGEGGYESGKTTEQKKASWFGWGGSPTTSKGGYERVKSD